MTQSQITHHASTSLHLVPQDRWLRDQYTDLVNIIGKPIKGLGGTETSMVGKIAISSKWLFRKKNDELRNVIRNKARLVAQGFSQEEGIEYEETFAPLERIEAIRIFLAYATYINFIVFQMDIKSC
nr:retrovirus-related Pol polyprotein from transposon TNT 1-94 [Tanacetum cinerariifolium]